MQIQYVLVCNFRQRRRERQMDFFYGLDDPLVQHVCTNRSHQSMDWSGHKSRCSCTWRVPGEYHQEKTTASFAV